MKKLQNIGKLLAASLIIFGLSAYLQAQQPNAVSGKHTADSVKAMIKKNNLTIVDFDYVNKAINDGTRKNAKAIIIDARPKKKYRGGHIPSSLSLPDSKFDKKYTNMFGKVDKNKEIITYCGGYACAKSAKVAIMLSKKGHKNVKVYTAGMPEWNKKNYVEIDTKVARALFDKRDSLFIDARPYKKYAAKTILGAISVPDTKFDIYKGFMPNDKKTSIITFCGGYACHKSHSIAKKLVEMGYKNVKVFAAGFPAWKRFDHPTTGGGKVAAAKKMVIKDSKSGVLKVGPDSGTVNGKWFVKNYNKLPKSVTLVNVTAPDDYKKGHIKGSINIQAEKMTPKQLANALPKSGDVIFYCGTGTRALEARGFLEDMKYKQIDRIWYLDAKVSCKGTDCKIQANDPMGI